MGVRLRPASSEQEVKNVPEGEYRVRLSTIDYHDTTGGPYAKAEPDLKWVLTIRSVEDAEESDDGDPEEWIGKDLWLFTGQSMGVRRDGSPTKGKEAVQALLGRTLEDDEEADTSELIGRECIATVGRSQTGRTKVVRMRRLPKKAGRPQPKAEPDDDADPWDGDE